MGQGEDLDAVVAKAYATGAKKAVVLDLRCLEDEPAFLAQLPDLPAAAP